MKGTVEEELIKRARGKLALEQVVMQNIDENLNAEDLNSILKHGAKEILSDDVNLVTIDYNEEALEELLDRQKLIEAEAKKVSVVEEAKKEEEGTKNWEFKYTKVWEEKKEGQQEAPPELKDVKEDDTNFWEKLLEQKYLAMQKSEVELGKGKRVRKKIEYVNLDDSNEESEEFVPGEEGQAEDAAAEDSDGEDESFEMAKKKKKKRKTADLSSAPSLLPSSTNPSLFSYTSPSNMPEYNPYLPRVAQSTPTSRQNFDYFDPLQPHQNQQAASTSASYKPSSSSYRAQSSANTTNPPIKKKKRKKVLEGHAQTVPVEQTSLPPTYPLTSVTPTKCIYNQSVYYSIPHVFNGQVQYILVPASNLEHLDPVQMSLAMRQYQIAAYQQQLEKIKQREEAPPRPQDLGDLLQYAPTFNNQPLNSLPAKSANHVKETIDLTRDEDEMK